MFSSYVSTFIPCSGDIVLTQRFVVSNIYGHVIQNNVIDRARKNKSARVRELFKTRGMENASFILRVCKQINTEGMENLIVIHINPKEYRQLCSAQCQHQ